MTTPKKRERDSRVGHNSPVTDKKTCYAAPKDIGDKENRLPIRNGAYGYDSSEMTSPTELQRQEPSTPHDHFLNKLKKQLTDEIECLRKKDTPIMERIKRFISLVESCFPLKDILTSLEQHTLWRTLLIEDSKQLAKEGYFPLEQQPQAGLPPLQQLLGTYYFALALKYKTKDFSISSSWIYKALQHYPIHAARDLYSTIDGGLDPMETKGKYKQCTASLNTFLNLIETTPIESNVVPMLMLIIDVLRIITDILCKKVTAEGMNEADNLKLRTLSYKNAYYINIIFHLVSKLQKQLDAATEPSPLIDQLKNAYGKDCFIRETPAIPFFMVINPKDKPSNTLIQAVEIRRNTLEKNYIDFHRMDHCKPLREKAEKYAQGILKSFSLLKPCTTRTMTSFIDCFNSSIQMLTEEQVQCLTHNVNTWLRRQATQDSTTKPKSLQMPWT